MKYVYILWHSYEKENHEDSKLIGVYETEDLALATKEKMLELPGFNLYPNRFIIDKYQMNEDHWIEGFGI